MNKKELHSKKRLYYGFPILLIGYKDENHGYNFTTISSSFTLADRMVIGIYKFGNAIKQIKLSRCFTVNVPGSDLMREIEIGGYNKNSGKDKFGLTPKLHYHPSDKIDAPIIENCALNIECEAIDIVESAEFDYNIIIAKMKGRLIDESLYMDEGSFKLESFRPIFYFGDDSRRSYRYLNDEMHDLGSFSK